MLNGVDQIAALMETARYPKRGTLLTNSGSRIPGHGPVAGDRTHARISLATGKGGWARYMLSGRTHVRSASHRLSLTLV